MAPYLNAKLLGSCALAVAMATASPVVSQEFGNWDTDDEAGISQPEWNSGLDQNGLYDDLDTDNDSQLSEDEFNAGASDAFESDPGSRQQATIGDGSAYDRWDTDGDGHLSENEFRAGTYQSFDGNGDGLIDNREFPRFGAGGGSGAGLDVPSLQGERGGGGVGGGSDIGGATDFGGDNDTGVGSGHGGATGGGGTSIGGGI
ncbi:hypothetical protein [Pelagibius sp. 7325]|uniref:hypothetical protein n=1 Tax=Pelagibius sp. 7325 TaxID=3131994 RepID=UPI0030EC2A42